MTSALLNLQIGLLFFSSVQLYLLCKTQMQKKQTKQQNIRKKQQSQILEVFRCWLSLSQLLLFQLPSNNTTQDLRRYNL